MNEVGLFDHDDLAAELGLSDGESLGRFWRPGGYLFHLEEINNVDSLFAFADLGLPTEGEGHSDTSVDSSGSRHSRRGVRLPPVTGDIAVPDSRYQLVSL